jgi:Xaa-Pro aminopeptidase
MSDTTTTESADGAARIETRQGCCGGGTTRQDDSCCGSETTTQTESACCGESEPETQESSCCGGSSCGGDGSGDSGRKTPGERERTRVAAKRTEALLAEMADAWTPDWTEADASEFLHDRMREAGDDAAWSWEYCPAVHAGADAAVGHTLPGDRTVPAGELLHVDFGVSHEGYAADLQRVYYHPAEPGEAVPDDLQAAFADVRAALDAGLRALEPGVQGHEVDAAARVELTDRGWSEFGHAFGHQVGRDAHDGGTLLGPLRDRYGDRPRGEVEAGEVYSVELGVGTAYGYVGQEEMVEVVERGMEFVVEPQTDLRRLER